MRRMLRNFAVRADRCLQRYPRSTLACAIVLCIVAEIVLLWGIQATLQAPHQATADPVAARPVDKVTSRLQRDRAASGRAQGELPPQPHGGAGSDAVSTSR